VTRILSETLDWASGIIDWISGAAKTDDDARRRRIRRLFLLLIAITPVLIFVSSATLSLFEIYRPKIGNTVLFGVSVLFWLVSRAFKAEKSVSVVFGFWVLAIIAAGPIYFGAPGQISLLALILVPLIMGSVAGASASLIGIISVLLAYCAVFLSALYNGTEITESSIALISYSTLCTVSVGVLVSNFHRRIEPDPRTLAEENAAKRSIALMDPLTQCSNRRAFQMDIAQLAHAAVEHSRPALFIMDLDRFKLINDTFGHDVGDEVLRVFAARLRTQVGIVGHVYRLGGDEFAVLCRDGSSQSALNDLGERIMAISDESISTQAGDVAFDVSIGIAMSDGSERSLNQLYRRADNAAFAAKKTPGSTCLVFNTQIDGQITRRYEVEELLKTVVAQQSIGIAFQPQYDLRTGSITAFEALARLTDPKLGKVSPAEFIQVAEQTLLIEALDRQIISAALRHAANWLGGQQRVSVNVSAKSLESSGLADFIVKHVLRHDLRPEQVEVEITETALIENWSATKITVGKLRSAGIRIVLDDFGIGYSSLSYLSEFPVQKLKFDRSFLLKASENSNSLIMQSIINLAKDIEVDIVAEGIETRDQLLLQLKCYHGQGFLLGKPIPAQEMEQFLSNQRVVA
jgi:diguanylate cyclase (GGDEF)-like protein